MTMKFKTMIGSDDAPITRKVGDGGSSGRIYVPKSWIGGKVTVILEGKEE